MQKHTKDNFQTNDHIKASYYKIAIKKSEKVNIITKNNFMKTNTTKAHNAQTSQSQEKHASSP